MIVKVMVVAILSSIGISCAFVKGRSSAEVKMAVTDSLPPVKPYQQFVNAATKSRKGLITVHNTRDKWYFELSPEILAKEILVVNRISQSAAAGTAYGGDWIGESVLKFLKGPYNKVQLLRLSYRDVSNDTSDNGMYRSVMNSQLQPIVASFDIKAKAPDSASVLVDVTDYLNGDNDVFFFSPDVKKSLELGGLQTDKSFIKDVLSFPLNTEIKTVKTFTGGTQNRLMSFELNSSLVLLPGQPMRPRYHDERVGYFSRDYIFYDQPQAVKVNRMITRWRLEPRLEDLDRYFSGQLVEPSKPIVFYIDPATPKKWVPYLIQGVNAWQRCFEKAGFKNAIYAREVAADDSAWSLEDARHSVLVYKASPIQNASGPQVSDPRTGEILESHINWYHNVQQLLHDWYLIQAGPNDPMARQPVLPDSLMGKLIAYVCTHEVGHTLGLMHNFVASAAYPVDSLRSVRFVRSHGHTPSIMDYARFNYVAQPEDGFKEDDLIPRIGVYDEWAVEWGYRLFPGNKSVTEERSDLSKWLTSILARNKELFYSDPFPADPRNQMEDLGDDASKAGIYGIENLKRVYVNLLTWTKDSFDVNYRATNRLYEALLAQYRSYLNFAAANIGGLMRSPRTPVQQGVVLEFPSRGKQQNAVKFLNDQLFTTPHWLMDKKLFPYLGGNPVIWLYKTQEAVLHSLVQASRWNMMLFNETTNTRSPYLFTEMLDDLEHNIWSELTTGNRISMERRSLQKIYCVKIMELTRFTRDGDHMMLDLFTVGTTRIKKLYAMIEAGLAKYKDLETREHLLDLRTRLKAALDYQRRQFPGIMPMAGAGTP